MPQVIELPDYTRYTITLLKSQSHSYAKEKGKAIRFPFLNTFQSVELESFYDLYLTYEKLLDQPKVTQILGIPQPETEGIVRRTKSNFDYPEATNYLLLDVDKDVPLHASYQEAIETAEITEEVLIKQTKFLLKRAFPEQDTPEFILRLSSNFSVENFRAHIWVPISAAVNPRSILIYMSRYKWIDVSPLRNPTQPVFTAAPIKDDSQNLDNIPEKRLYYSTGTQVDHSIFVNHISSDKYTGEYTPASDLPDDIGSFNRHHDVHKWLNRQGYKQISENRYISPDSESGQAGCVLYEGGYVVDFHDTSPIRKYLKNNSLRPLSAYDLHYIEHKYKDTLRSFHQQVYKTTSKDPVYQQFWEKRIRLSTSYVTEATNLPELELIVQSLVEDVFKARLSQPRKQGIFETIVKLLPKVEGYKVTLGTLNKQYTNLRRQLAQDMFEIHPDNKDLLNAEAFLADVGFYRAETHWVAEDTDRLRLLPTTVEAEQFVSKRLTEMSTDPLGWNLGKIKSATQAVLMKATPPPVSSQHLFAFPDVPKAISTMSGEIQDISLQDLVTQTLPFTYREYKERKDPDHFLKFLDTTFSGNESRIQTIRDLFNYLLYSKRKAQIVFALIGRGRSGKSTIKNLLSELLGRSRVLEVMPGNLRDDFGLAKLTTETRILVVNEFNASGLRNSHHGNLIVNSLKAISGRDEIVIRRMRENPTTITSDVLPLLISNEPPAINDQAFQARLKVVMFDKSFFKEASKDNGQFYENLLSELPGIFHWAITNDFKAFKSTEKDKELVAEVLDLKTSFLTRYTEETNDPKDSVCKKEIVHYYASYFAKKKGYSPTDEDLNPRLFSLGLINTIYPNSQTTKRKPTLASSLDLSNKEWSFTGIKWKDPEIMFKELSEFDDYLE